MQHKHMRVFAVPARRLGSHPKTQCGRGSIRRQKHRTNTSAYSSPAFYRQYQRKPLTDTRRKTHRNQLKYPTRRLPHQRQNSAGVPGMYRSQRLRNTTRHLPNSGEKTAPCIEPLPCSHALLYAAHLRWHRLTCRQNLPAAGISRLHSSTPRSMPAHLQHHPHWHDGNDILI